MIKNNQKQQNNQLAKTQALLEMNKVQVKPTAIVSFQSKGSLLIIGNSIEKMQNIAKQLSNNFVIYYLNTDVNAKISKDIPNLSTATVREIKGYLGAFKVEVMIGNTVQELTAQQQKFFDIVIDLSVKPTQGSSIQLAEVLPFGHYVIQTQALSQALIEEINILIGTLDKPKFLNFESDICIHTRNKITLCERCINSCPAQAIHSDGQNISVDFYLCHGFGSCASACPTGAISYAYPSMQDNCRKMHTLINQYLYHKGKHPVVLFYPQDKMTNTHNLDTLDAKTLPFPLEEVGTLSLDFLLYVFCLGVEQVFVLCSNEPTTVQRQINREVNLAYKILNDLGYQMQQPSYNQLTENLSIQISDNTPILKESIGLIDTDNKRERIFAIVDFLYEHKYSKEPLTQCDFDSNDDIFFGSVEINKESCTLCLACASVCPTHALFSDNPDKPTVRFKESLCVQCTLCAQSCPEGSIQLNPRLLYDKTQREQQQTLNQDEPFRCITCDKIFASKQVIGKITKQLQDHAMFAGAKLTNLKMCEDCRVKALFDEA